jgi:hypothetical protein
MTSGSYVVTSGGGGVAAEVLGPRWSVGARAGTEALTSTVGLGVAIGASTTGTGAGVAAGGVTDGTIVGVAATTTGADPAIAISRGAARVSVVH